MEIDTVETDMRLVDENSTMDVGQGKIEMLILMAAQVQRKDMWCVKIARFATHARFENQISTLYDFGQNRRRANAHGTSYMPYIVIGYH